MAEPSSTIAACADRLRTAGMRHRAALVPASIGLMLFAFVVASRGMTVGGFTWSDAPLHAMDGVFLHDLVRDWPGGSWRAWAEDYYLKHQCLGIVVYYPPLFAAVEAVLFAALGISVWVARLTVVLFVAGAVWLIFMIGRELFGTVAGVVGAVLALVTPAGVAWSRQVMLEWPAVFWISLTLFAYLRYRRRQNWRWGMLMAAGCLGAYLTKQTAVFVLGVIVLHACLHRRWAEMRKPAFWAPMAVACAGIAVYGLATAGTNALAPQLIAGQPPWRHLRTVDAWAWYLLRLPNILGWPVIVATAAALVVMLRDWKFRFRVSLPIVWALTWWLTSTVLAAKEERYFFFAVPAIGLLAGAGLVELSRWRAGKPLVVLLAAFVVFGMVRVAGRPAAHPPDMKPTVAWLSQQPDVDLVLIDAVRDGQFIFDVRANPRADGRIIPMRASKLLYSRAARTRYDYQQHVNSPADIMAVLDSLGIRYVVLEDRLPTASEPGRPADEDRSWDTPPRLMLRELVRDETRFERVFSQSMRCDDPIWADMNLVTYRYKNAPQRQIDTVIIPFPAMGKNLELRLELDKEKSESLPADRAD